MYHIDSLCTPLSIKTPCLERPAYSPAAAAAEHLCHVSFCQCPNTAFADEDVSDDMDGEGDEAMGAQGAEQVSYECSAVWWHMCAHFNSIRCLPSNQSSL